MTDEIRNEHKVLWNARQELQLDITELDHGIQNCFFRGGYPGPYPFGRLPRLYSGYDDEPIRLSDFGADDRIRILTLEIIEMKAEITQLKDEIAVKKIDFEAEKEKQRQIVEDRIGMMD